MISVGSIWPMSASHHFERVLSTLGGVVNLKETTLFERKSNLQTFLWHEDFYATAESTRFELNKCSERFVSRQNN